ncbi:MAG: LacI family transcriptional regulator [Hyphomonadaceae bacterium]|nr:LacI family transcriptional regulator [Hyphomonadaceae bacterium]
MANNPRKKNPPEDESKVIPLIKGRRATSYDVARLAGVSQSAVSRCFKPGSSISGKMRERVMKAAKELEYQPNAIARGLITQRSNLVAVLVSGRLNLYYPEVLFKITEELSAAGLRALLFTVDSEDDADMVIEQAWQFQVDGVISASHMSKEQYAVLEKRQIPVVFFNRYFADHPNTVVYCDPSEQVEEVVKQLSDLGHRNASMITGPSANMVSRERARLVETSLKRNGIELISTVQGDFTYESGAAGLQEIQLHGSGAPTVIICVNDMMAMGCMDEARSVLELDVPKDLSIVGFDGIGMSQFSSYELTTIRQPIGRMSESAVRMITERVERPDQSHEKRVFEGAVIPGGSIARAPT